MGCKVSLQIHPVPLIDTEPDKLVSPTNASDAEASDTEAPDAEAPDAPDFKTFFTIDLDENDSIYV